MIHLSRPVTVVPYDPKWPLLFQKEKNILQAILGNNCHEIYHIGSTSVTDLSAKPIIDILISVHNLKDIEKIIPDMQAVGYESRGEFGIPLRAFFTKGIDPRAYNVHIFEKGNSEVERHLIFRDWLRSHEDDKNTYENLKKELAHTFAQNSFEYQKGKTRLINSIHKKAGWKKPTLFMCALTEEWDAYHRIKEEEIFLYNKKPYDKNHFSHTNPAHTHFVMYDNNTIVTIAHIEFLSESEAALRTIATDKNCQGKGYGTIMMNLLEQWVKYHNRSMLKFHTRPEAIPFYTRLGYVPMDFSYDKNIILEEIDMGKIL